MKEAIVTIDDWIEGESITWRELSGTVNFISPEYITMCIRVINEPDNVDPHSLKNSRAVCVLVFQQFWHEVVRNSSK